MITSERDPAVRVHLPSSAQYVDAERWVLYVMADGELHAFVDVDAQKKVQRLHWVQFEGYLPTRPELKHTYDSAKRANLGGMDFMWTPSLWATERFARSFRVVLNLWLLTTNWLFGQGDSEGRRLSASDSPKFIFGDYILAHCTAIEPAVSPASRFNWHVRGSWVAPTARTTEFLSITKYGCTRSESWTTAVSVRSLQRICFPATLIPVTISVESVPSE